MPQSLPILFIPDKQKTARDPSDLPVAFRTIERWANQITLATGITEITSVDGTVTITNPTGPTVDLHVTPGGGGGAPYASLTGPGYTTTPGNLTQAGGFIVNAAANSFQANTSFSGGTADIVVQATGPPAISLTTTSVPSAGINFSTIIRSVSSGPILIDCHGGLYQGIYMQAGGGTISGAGVQGIELHANTGTILLQAQGGVAATGQYVQLAGLGTGYPLYLASGPPSSTISNANLLVWTGQGPPTGLAALGNTTTPQVADFYFDVHNGAIYATTYNTTTWRLIA
jgi:hypothetical protein